MDDDFFRREYDSGPQKRDHLFLWTVFILLLTGGVLACWLGSFYVFGHPENPKNYRLLMRLHKLEPPRRFEDTAAPPGEFYTPQKLYEKYATMPDAGLQQQNAGLLRDYIRNYQNTNNAVPYLTGKFTILKSRELSATDLFSPGMIALAQCAEYPQVLLEYVYTTAPSGVAYVKETLGPGVQITLERTTGLSAILHIEKLDDGRLLLTAMPITYGSYTLKNGPGTFSLDPPSALHLEGGVPIIKASAIPPAGKNYAARLANTPAPGVETTESAASSPSPGNKELVRVMPPIALATPKQNAKHGTPSPTPAVARSTPLSPPVPIPIPSAAQITRVTPPPAPLEGTPPAFAQNTTNATPAPDTSPEPGMATPTPLPSVAADHPDVALQPFIEAQSSPAVTGAGSLVENLSAGENAARQVIEVSDAATLADQGVGGEELYLSGQFTVTASGDNHAVLRAKSGVLSVLNPLVHSSSTRVFVEFPAGYQPPAEGATISRDEQRPFEIREVRRERDGTINVYVREITTGQ